MKSKWLKVFEDFSIEIDENAERAIKNLQYDIPKEDVYIYLFVMLYVNDMLFEDLFSRDKALFIDVMKEKDEFANLAKMCSRKMEFMFSDFAFEEENDN